MNIAYICRSKTMTRPQKSEYNILSDFHISIDYTYYWWYVYIMIGIQMNAENARLFSLTIDVYALIRVLLEILWMFLTGWFAY